MQAPGPLLQTEDGRLVVAPGSNFFAIHIWLLEEEEEEIGVFICKSYSADAGPLVQLEDGRLVAVVPPPGQQVDH